MGPLEFKAIASDREGTFIDGTTLTDHARLAIDLFPIAVATFLLTTGNTIDQLSEYTDHHRLDQVCCETGPVPYWPRERPSKLLTSKRSREVVGNLQIEDLKAEAIDDVIISAKATDKEWLRQAVYSSSDGTRA